MLRLSVDSVPLPEIKCVSRNEAGKTVVTAPGGSYKDPSMSKCESCVCGLYGQIRLVIIVIPVTIVTVPVTILTAVVTIVKSQLP